MLTSLQCVFGVIKPPRYLSHLVLICVGSGYWLSEAMTKRGLIWQISAGVEGGLYLVQLPARFMRTRLS